MFGILTTALSGCQRFANLFGGDDEPSTDGYDFRPLLKDDYWQNPEVDPVALAELEGFVAEVGGNVNPLVSDYLIQRCGAENVILEEYDNPPKWWLVEFSQSRNYQYKYWIGPKTGNRRLADPQSPINEYGFNPARQRLVITRAGQVVFDSSRPMEVAGAMTRQQFLRSLFSPFRIA